MRLVISSGQILPVRRTMFLWQARGDACGQTVGRVQAALAGAAQRIEILDSGSV
jgi:hypothetical protein